MDLSLVSLQSIEQMLKVLLLVIFSLRAPSVCVFSSRHSFIYPINTESLLLQGTIPQCLCLSQVFRLVHRHRLNQWCSSSTSSSSSASSPYANAVAATPQLKVKWSFFPVTSTALLRRSLSAFLSQWRRWRGSSGNKNIVFQSKVNEMAFAVVAAL